jgi:hypothetical protein
MKNVESPGERGYKEKLAILRVQIAALKKDLANIQTLGLKRHALNEILQKENAIATAIKKHNARAAIQPPPVGPTPREKPPQATKKRLTPAATT